MVKGVSGMKRLWQDYDGAIAALAEDKREKLTRGEATELLGISTGVFGREIRMNSMFIAKCEPEITSTATYYKREALIAHFERLRDEVEPAKLIVDRHVMSDVDFEKCYGKKKEVVFAPGTYLCLGGWNE